MFEFGVTQTDPNFANYRYQPGTGRLVLLDFGAALLVNSATVRAYRRLLQAGFVGDRDAVRDAAVAACSGRRRWSAAGSQNAVNAP